LQKLHVRLRPLDGFDKIGSLVFAAHDLQRLDRYLSVAVGAKDMEVRREMVVRITSCTADRKDSTS
jgi:hypothetical protein